MLTVGTQKVDKAILEQNSLFCVRLPLLHNDSTGQSDFFRCTAENDFSLSKSPNSFPFWKERISF